MSRPRVLLVSPVSEFKGGAEVVLRIMLANPHIDPVLAVPEEGPIEQAARSMGVPVCFYRPGAMLRVHRPPRPGAVAAALADAVRCARRLQRLAREHECRIAHSNGLKPHMLLALLGSSPRLRTLVHLHDIPYRRSERMLWRAIARRVTRIIMVSRPCYPAAALPANVEVVRNGIAMVGDDPPDLEPSPGPMGLGFGGGFHPNTGLDLLVDWFAAVRAAGIDATLTIRGRADPDKPDYWPAIQARIKESGWAEHVREEGWTTGAATYANLDVLLIPSKTPDPAPLVVPEAMSAGVIVAAYPAGGIPTMIEDRRTGLLVERGETLARELMALRDNPAAAAELRRTAYDHVRSNYGIAGFHARLRDVYSMLLVR